MKKILVLLLMILGTQMSFSQEGVRYVYSSTTAEAIDELNRLVPDYNERRKVLIKMREMESQGVVFVSTEQYKPISKKIKNNETLLSNDPRDVENKVYADNAKKRYKTVKDLLKK